MWVVLAALAGASVVGSGVFLATGFAVGGLGATDVPELLGVCAAGAPGVVGAVARAQVVLKERWC